MPAPAPCPFEQPAAAAPPPAPPAALPVIIEGPGHTGSCSCACSCGKELRRSPSYKLLPRMEKWHWLVMMVATIALTLGADLAMDRSMLAKPGRRQGLQVVQQAELSNFELQLAGCRTRKTQPIPYVDTSSSVRVLRMYTPQQQQQAERFTEEVAACKDFACLRKANKLPRAPGQFRFPHFMIIGFPKCATTSIYCHLIQHPQVQYPQEKEGNVLLEGCGHQLANCSKAMQQEYITKMLNLEEAALSNFTKAAFEGSTHYVKAAGWLPEQLGATFPWLKIVVSVRDPISQSIAMLLHNLVHGRSVKCWEDSRQRVYPCILEQLESPERARYAPTLGKWMAFFPRQRLHVVQFENLTRQDSMAGATRDLKDFLEINPYLPSERLPLTNYKHQRVGRGELGQYWNMTRAEYEHVVTVARRNTVELIRLLSKHGYIDRAGKVDWLMSWERVWKANMKTCGTGPEGECRIVVS